MPSPALSQIVFAAPTPPPLPHYSLVRLTGLAPELPAHHGGILSAFGRVLQRILAQVSTTGIKCPYLSLDYSSRLRVHATATIPYGLGPSVTLVQFDSSRTIILPALIALLVSVLFGVALVLHLCRRGKTRSNADISERERGDLSPKSLYSDSSTLFCQHDTPTISPISLIWLRALNLVLCGLAFLCRVICLEKLLNAIDEQNPTADNRFPELRALVQAINADQPIQPIINADPLPDSDNTLVSPFSSGHAKSKLVQFLLPVVENGAKVIPLLDVEPAWTEIHTDSTSKECNSVTPAVLSSVEPCSAPDKPLPTTVLCPPTPPRNEPLSVEPSGAPENSVVTPEPRLSSYQAELRSIFQRCMEDEDTPRKPLKNHIQTFDDPRTGKEYVSQIEIRRIFQPLFDDPAFQPDYSRLAAAEQRMKDTPDTDT